MLYVGWQCCSLLNAALVSISKAKVQGSDKSALSVQAAQFGFWVFPDADLVESVESSAVSKSLITSKL